MTCLFVILWMLINYNNKLLYQIVLQEEMESNVITALYILVILTKLMKSCNAKEEYRVHQLVFRLNKLQVSKY